VTEAARIAAKFSRDMIAGNDDNQLKEMAAKGAKVNAKPDVAAFREAVQPAYAKAREKYGADVDAFLPTPRPSARAPSRPCMATPLLRPVAPRRCRAPVGRAVDWAVIAIGAVMATMVFVNVSLHLFDKDLAWVTEFGELLMVWVTFLGGACAAQRGAHMTITEFIDKLAPAKRRWADARRAVGLPGDAAGAGALRLVAGQRQLGQPAHRAGVADGHPVHGHGGGLHADGAVRGLGRVADRCAACRAKQRYPHSE
jgi:hypothetical protein